MQTLLQDLRYGFRTLSRERAFAAVSILTLAVALGANSAIFTLVNAILLRPLPFPNADRVIRVENKNLQTGKIVGPHSYPNIVDVGRMKSVESVAAST